MKRSLVALLAFALVVVGGLAQAQSKPDFTGTWVLDRDRSDPPGMGPGGAGGPGGGGGTGGSGGPGGPGGFRGDATLTIAQSASELKIQREGRDGAPMTSSYALDGSESKNPGMRGGESRSKSHWDGAALVTEGQQTMDTPNGPVTMEFKDVRRLEDGGKTMVV